MYSCVHCKKEKALCQCHSNFTLPTVPHDIPGRKHVFRWYNPFEEWGVQFSEDLSVFVQVMKDIGRAIARVPYDLIASTEDSSSKETRLQSRSLEKRMEKRRRYGFFGTHHTKESEK